MLETRLIDERRAGVLLHPTSFPSGCLSGDVERWLDVMQDAGLRVWQMLPLVIPDHTGSPYQSCSAFAVDPALLSADTTPTRDVVGQAAEFEAFMHREREWLPDFARFQVLKKRFNGAPWFDWPPSYRDRDPEALAQFDASATADIAGIVEQQFALELRWKAIRAAARERDVQLFGDMPIFVALDSADVWADSSEFLLDDSGHPTHVAGVPPDYFSETGQRWGNPHYDWTAMQATDFRWWKARLRRQLDWFDIVRLDHFRGLEASWMIPAECETAIGGEWQKVPGEALLKALKEEFPDLPIVAEDLGVITPEVTALRKQFDLPGMAVIQFAFDAFDDNPHKPKNMRNDTVVYTGTHDNNTTLGWFSELDEGMRHFVFELLGSAPREDVHRLLIESAYASRASLAIAPMQDLLGLGAAARMNTPGLVGENWRWRFDWSQLNPETLDWLHAQAREHGRLV